MTVMDQALADRRGQAEADPSVEGKGGSLHGVSLPEEGWG